MNEDEARFAKKIEKIKAADKLSTTFLSLEQQEALQKGDALLRQLAEEKDIDLATCDPEIGEQLYFEVEAQIPGFIAASTHEADVFRKLMDMGEG